MKHITGVTTGAIALAAAFAGSALADGLPRRAPVVVAPPPVVDRCAPGPWTGFYVGGNLGWASSDGEFNDHDKFFSYHDRFDDEDDGFTAGVQSGYNLQCGNVVFGIESDWNWLDIGNDSRHYGWYDAEFNRSRQLDWFGTLRGRLGFTNDRGLMVYATAGLAYTDGGHDWRGEGWDTYHDANWSVDHRDSDDVQWGWTAGGGVEWLWSDRVSFKAEALWIDFEDGSKSRVIEFCDYYSCWDEKKRFSHDDNLWVARIGVNFRFGHREPVYEPLK
ncbi:MAG: outer membrane beta-barrel protein [Hyphomicrobiaceae bacterium]|nr:outer membrane beta-barrel protein [Hyphomicrobiaceae bacterium]